MANHQLKIHFENGEISILDADGQPADSITVQGEDTIQFKCEDHGWGVQFLQEGPASNPTQSPPVSPMSVRGKSGSGWDGSHTITVDPDTRITPGNHWGYVAAIEHDGEVYTRDPEIVIGDRNPPA